MCALWRTDDAKSFIIMFVRWPFSLSARAHTDTPRPLTQCRGGRVAASALSVKWPTNESGWHGSGGDAVADTH